MLGITLWASHRSSKLLCRQLSVKGLESMTSGFPFQQHCYLEGSVVDLPPGFWF